MVSELIKKMTQTSLIKRSCLKYKGQLKNKLNSCLILREIYIHILI